MLAQRQAAATAGTTPFPTQPHPLPQSAPAAEAAAVPAAPPSPPGDNGDNGEVVPPAATTPVPDASTPAGEQKGEAGEGDNAHVENNSVSFYLACLL